MALRDRILALAGLHLLGDNFPRLANILPSERQAEAIAALRGLDRAQAAERLLRLRKRQAQRMSRIARKRFGVAWDQLDPRLAQTVLLHGRNQNH